MERTRSTAATGSKHLKPAWQRELAAEAWSALSGLELDRGTDRALDLQWSLTTGAHREDVLAKWLEAVHAALGRGQATSALAVFSAKQVDSLKEEIALLRSEVAKFRAQQERDQMEIRACRRELAEATRLRHELEDIRLALGLSDKDVPEPDEAWKWLQAHPEIVEEHRGRQIALFHEGGIAASAEDLDALYDQLKERDLLGKVVIESIPSR